ncbi:MAG TPA: PfkB family carbohydrate kinase [Planctomycetota bacterium]
MLDVLGIGCTAIDDLIYVESFPQADSKNRVLRRERHCGGLTATALVAAARMGAKASYAGMLGTDELSDFAVSRLSAESISLQHLVRDPAVLPVYSVIIVATAEQSRCILHDHTRVVCAHPDLPSAEVIRSARVLFVDNVALPNVLRAAKIAAAAGIPIVGDVENAKAPGFNELLPLVDHLIVSSDFAALLAGVAPASVPAGTQERGVAPASVPAVPDAPEPFRKYWRRLPHWRLEGAYYFVNWRLRSDQAELSPHERSLVVSALMHFNSQRYTLIAYVIMGDHVHVIVQPTKAHTLESIVQSWKSYTANRMQHESGRQGAVWEHEYYDRILRNDSEFYEKLDYIQNNPFKRWPELTEYQWMAFLAGTAPVPAGTEAGATGATAGTEAGATRTTAGTEAGATRTTAGTEAGATRTTAGAEAGATAQKLHARLGKTVVVTCGKDGLWCAAPGRDVFFQPAFQVTAVDTTGCGDVFHGAYAAALAQGLSLEDRLRLASAAAALKATQPGGQLGIPSRSQVETFLEEQSAKERKTSV